jgi:hypothetical protein
MLRITMRLLRIIIAKPISITKRAIMRRPHITPIWRMAIICMPMSIMNMLQSIIQNIIHIIIPNTLTITSITVINDLSVFKMKGPLKTAVALFYGLRKGQISLV